MRIELRRKWLTDKSTIGELFINGSKVCYTLEDVVREIPNQKVKLWKVQNKTAIPRGFYRVSNTYSPRFKRVLPILHGVEGFTGVRIHSGNTASNTEGCILVGMTRATDFVGSSRVAFSRVFALIDAALKRGEVVTITIK